MYHAPHHPPSSIDAQVNFQRASCTIDAGVKIYSCRVDSVLNDAVKMLGGGLQDDQGTDAYTLGTTTYISTTTDEANEEGAKEQQGAKPTRRKAAEVNPASTLRDAADLTLTTIDHDQHADPLFHKMSAQFDAGGPGGMCRHVISTH